MSTPAIQRRPRVSYLLAAGGLVMLSLGATLFGFGAFLEIAKISAAAKWPVVEGTVAIYDAVAGCKDAAAVAPQVAYDYTYAGKSYRGNRRGFAMNVCDTPANVAAITSQYPAGAAVRVHVNPARPAEAVLETTVDTAALWAMGIAALLLGATAMAWILPRLRRALGSARAQRPPV